MFQRSAMNKVSKEVAALRADCQSKKIPPSKNRETMKIRIQGVQEQAELHDHVVNDLQQLSNLLSNFLKSKSKEMVQY